MAPGPDSPVCERDQMGITQMYPSFVAMLDAMLLSLKLLGLDLKCKIHRWFSWMHARQTTE